MINKIYFTLKKNIDQDGNEDFWWENNYGDKLRFAGKPKFILTALRETYGKEDGDKIYRAFLSAVENIPNHFGTFVMYKKHNIKNKDL